MNDSIRDRFTGDYRRTQFIEEEPLKAAPRKRGPSLWQRIVRFLFP